MLNLCTFRFAVRNTQRLKKAVQYSGKFNAIRFPGTYDSQGNIIVPPTEIDKDCVARVLFTNETLGFWRILEAEELRGYITAITLVLEESDFVPPLSRNTPVFFMKGEMQIDDIGQPGIVQEGVVLHSGPTRLVIGTLQEERIEFTPGQRGAFWEGHANDLWAAFPDTMIVGSTSARL